MTRSKKIAPLLTDLGPESIAEAILTPMALSPASQFKRLSSEFSKALDESASLSAGAKKMTGLISMSLSAFSRSSPSKVHNSIKDEKVAKVVRELLRGARRIQVEKAITRLDQLKHTLEERARSAIKVTVCKDPHGASLRAVAMVRFETKLIDFYQKDPVQIGGNTVPYSKCAVLCNNRMAPLGDTSVTVDFFADSGDITSFFFAPVAPEYVADPALRDPDQPVQQVWFSKPGSSPAEGNEAAPGPETGS